MARYHIVCSTKETSPCTTNGYYHIAKVGYPDSTGDIQVVTRATMVARLDAGDTAYTTGGGEVANVRVHTCNRCSTRFLKTDPDATKADNLQDLGSCWG